MNTIYFYTDVSFCEQSPYVLSCKQWRQSLTELSAELNFSFVIQDVRNLKPNREFIALGGQITPSIVIKDVNNNVIALIEPVHINPIIESMQLTFNTMDEYITTLKSVLLDQLTKYNAV